MMKCGMRLARGQQEEMKLLFHLKILTSKDG